MVLEDLTNVLLNDFAKAKELDKSLFQFRKFSVDRDADGDFSGYYIFRLTIFDAGAVEEAKDIIEVAYPLHPALYAILVDEEREKAGLPPHPMKK
jgi:hypothetical protein